VRSRAFITIFVAIADLTVRAFGVALAGHPAVAVHVAAQEEPHV
jgi:hypothetical protein